VDNVSAEGLAAGRSAARHALHHNGINLVAGQGIGYILPASLNAEQNQTISFRVRARVAPAVVKVGSMYTAHLAFAVPSEMVRLEIPKTAIQKYLQEQLHGDNFPADGALTVNVDILEDKEAEEKERKEKEAAAASAGATKEGQTVVDLTCICCPHGCALKVVKEGDKVVSVSGNNCSRGAAFGEQEVIDPRRVFSTTVPIEGAICGKIPVKLTQQFPKTRLIEAAFEIQKLRLKAPVKVGQVLIKDLLGEKGCDVVACRTLDVAAKESEKYTLGAEYVKRLEQEADAANAAKAAAAPKKEGAKDTLRLLPLFASNHANGNNAQQLAQFVAGAEEAAKAKGIKLEVATTINLNRKKIGGCTYCGACQKKPVPGCIIKDDMAGVMEQVLDADIICHAVPVWFWSAPSQFKAYLDRYTQLFTREWQLRDEVKDRTNGLTFAGIVTCGGPDSEKTCAGVVQSLSTLASFVPGWRWAGATTTSMYNGLSDDALKAAFELGKAAVEKALA